jgi:hypothetical protein
MIRLFAVCAVALWLSGCGGGADSPGSSATAAGLGAGPVDARHRRRYTQADTLVVTVAGIGTVASSPAGISCSGGSSACSQSFVNGASVTLTATAASGYAFSGWAGACSGSAPTCAVTLNSAQSVDATFTASPPTTTSHHLVSDPYPLAIAQPDHFDVSCDGSAPVASPPSVNSDGTSYLYFSLSGLPSGPHTCDVTAANAANQQSPAAIATFTL